MKDRPCCGDVDDADADAIQRAVLLQRRADEAAYAVGWRIWYDDESVYDSRTATWDDLPDDGVQFVVVYFRDGTKKAVSGRDYYFLAPFRGGGWILEVTDDPVIDAALRYPGARFKRGRFASDGFYRRITDEAMASTWE